MPKMPLYMAVMPMPNRSSANSPVLAALRAQFPTVQFHAGTVFRWSPQAEQVEYVEKLLDTDRGRWALLHETSHAILCHTNYLSDFELLTMEVAAWEKAKTLATSLNMRIHESHIQDCLDTYRDWLHRRSTCPTCGSVSLQQNTKTYHCHNCLATWHVTAERFCRPYRRIAISIK